VSCWTSYREFWFADGQADLRQAEMANVSQIATYMQNNPSLQLGIDGSLDPRNSSDRERDLSDLRVKTIRDALVKAGVPTDKIKVGAFGDVKLRRDRRVEVLYASAQ